MKQLEDSHLDDLTLKKRKSNLDKIEDFEKFVEEQLEYDGEDPRNNVLPYDPFSSEEEHSNDWVLLPIDPSKFMTALNIFDVWI